MATITVVTIESDHFRVTVDERETQTTHEVRVTAADLRRYAPGASPEQLIEASFRFLLAREPKESILPRFELPVIERYFPEYPARIREELEA